MPASKIQPPQSCSSLQITRRYNLQDFSHANCTSSPLAWYGRKLLRTRNSSRVPLVENPGGFVGCDGWGTGNSQLHNAVAVRPAFFRSLPYSKQGAIFDEPPRSPGSFDCSLPDNEKHSPPTESDVTANQACAAIPPEPISLEGATGFAFPISARAW